LAGTTTFRSYAGDQLLEMQCKDWPGFPGAGDLIFEVEVHTTGPQPVGRMTRAEFEKNGRRQHEHRTYHGFLMIENVNRVEKLVRETLVEPLQS
jgi:hypothetical protein